MSHESFRDAYQTLQKNAAKLRAQSEPDLDNLLEVVTQSVSAYKVCKSRIEAVERALEQALNNAGLADGEGGNEQPASSHESSSSEKPKPKHVFEDLDDEIPF